VNCLQICCLKPWLFITSSSFYFGSGWAFVVSGVIYQKQPYDDRFELPKPEAGLPKASSFLVKKELPES
jgi:hypothetical protein